MNENNRTENMELTSLTEALGLMPDDGHDFYNDLRDAAWDILHEKPDIDFNEWVQILLEQYPTEVVDALGIQEKAVYASLADMWHHEMCTLKPKVK